MKLKSSLIIFSLFFLALFINLTTESEMLENQEKELIDYVVPIHSIQPNDTNFSDFMFLNSILKENKIILLGEALHYDGSTFLAKIRLIKFLHETLGYDVLLWESGLFNVWYMNEEFKNNQELDPSLAMYHFWSKSKECEKLWKYINEQQKTENPIRLGGFDVQYSGLLDDIIFGNKIIDFLKLKGVDISDYVYFNSIIYQMGKNNDYFHNSERDFKEKDSVLTDLSNILKTIKTKITSFEDSIYFRHLNNTLLWYNCIWTYDHGHAKRLHLRDSLMADNLIWLIDQYYPESKVMVWSSNMHILFDNSLYTKTTLQDNVMTSFVSMGEYLKNQYGIQCYVLAFSSFCRLSERNTIFQKGGNKSIEYILHNNEIQYGFLDFRTIPERSFLHNEIIMRPNHSYDIKGKWSNMLDGLFYIDTMKNVHYP